MKKEKKNLLTFKSDKKKTNKSRTALNPYFSTHQLQVNMKNIRLKNKMISFIFVLYLNKIFEHLEMFLFRGWCNYELPKTMIADKGGGGGLKATQRWYPTEDLRSNLQKLA